MRWAAARVALALASAAALGACARAPRTGAASATGGDVERGRVAIAAYHCGACHVIPGVLGARGVVAPPLTAFARRTFIGGELPNTPENLIRWVRNPRQIEPRTAMPAVGLDEQEARDVAAYLYELR